MESNKIIKAYFIYAQKGQNSNISTIETNERIKNVQELSKEVNENSLQILYLIEISKSEEENQINLFLLNKQGELFISNIDFDYLKLLGEEKIDINENIFFEMKFELDDDNNPNNLGQIILPYDKQFSIFENQFKENDKIIFSLYLSTLSQVFLTSKQKFDFVLDFFLKIHEKINSNKLPEFKNILKYFFKNIKKILPNYIYAGKITIPEERLKILNDTGKIRTELLSLLGEAELEENVDIFLSYYYIHYKKKLFIEFINNQKYRDEIFTNLGLNRNIFNNFTNDIIGPELMQEAINGTELLSLMKLYPNIVECFKILTRNEIYLKFIYFKQIERKSINIMIIQTPQKTDDIELLRNYFKKTYDYFIEEKIYPLIIKEDFFFQYYKIFEEDEDNFHQLNLIIEMLNLYNIYNKQKNNSDELLKSFYEKGLSLIKNKKLKNLDFILFIKTVQI